MDQTGITEIKREKVFIPDGMTAREISEKHGIHINTAYNAKKKVSLSKIT